MESEDNSVKEVIAMIKLKDANFLDDDVEDAYELIEAIIDGQRWDFYPLLEKIPYACDLIVRIAGRSLNCKAMEELFNARDSGIKLSSQYIDPNDIFTWCLAASGGDEEECKRYKTILSNISILDD